MKRFAAWLLALALCVGATCAANADTSHQALSGWLDGTGETHLSATFALDALMPFDESGLAMINSLAKYLQLHATLGDAATTLTLSVGQDTLFSLTETELGGGSRLTTSLLPNRTLVAQQGSALALLAGDAPLEADDAPFSFADALAQLETQHEPLLNAFAPYAEEKKANYRIDDIGRARLSQTARLTTETGAAALAPIVATLSCGLNDAWRAVLAEATGVKKGFVVARYQTADGDDLALYMKGSLLLSDGAEMSLKFQWAFLRGDSHTDTYTLEASLNRKPKQTLAIEASGESVASAKRLSVKSNTSATQKSSGQTLATSLAVQLSGSASASKRTLEGSVTATRGVTVGGKKTQTETTLSPDIHISQQDGASTLSGSVAYAQSIDKQTQLAVRITLGENAQASQPYDPYSVQEDDTRTVEVVILSGDGEETSPRESTETNEYLVGATPVGLIEFTTPAEPVDTALTEEKRDALLTQAAQTLAGQLLKALSTLPGNDAAFLWDAMTEADVKAFRSLLENQ